MKKIYLLLSAAARTCVMIGCTPAPQDVAIDYLSALTSGELAKANELSVSDLHDSNKESIRVLTESTDINDKLMRISMLRSLEDLNDAIVVADGDYAVVYAKDGSTELFKLKKVNGAWKCYSWEKK